MYLTYKEFNEAKIKCRECPVGSIYNQVVCSIGNLIDPTYMMIGEAPGKDEVIKKQPFVGKAGIILRRGCIKHGFTKKNTVITNTIPCRPPNNKFPNDSVLVNTCISKWLLNEIELLKPKCILIVGSTPMKYLLGIKEGITKVRGRIFENLSVATQQGDDEFKDKYNVRIPTLITFHPSYLARNEHTELGIQLRQDFDKDLLKLKELPDRNQNTLTF